jgi:amino acid permease
VFERWNYWYNWIIVLPAELSAASVLINYWNKEVNNAVSGFSSVPEFALKKV